MHERGGVMERLTFAGEHLVARSPEGKTSTLPVAELADVLSPTKMDTGAAVLPERVCAVRSAGSSTVWVHQSPPAVYNLKWIRDDSPAPFGRGAIYRDVRIALPYLVVLVVFEAGPGGMNLSAWNECYFRTRPITSMDDALAFPALLNCSKFEPADGHPLAWICTQNLRPVPPTESDPVRRMWGGYAALLRCLLETGFNRSSEMHEGTSWYAESRGIDARIGTIESWEAASLGDPGFVLDVPWVPSGLTLAQILERLFEQHGDRRDAIRTTESLARLVERRAYQRMRRAQREALDQKKVEAAKATGLVQSLFG